ncbi:carbamoyl-phosphate synthase L chain ATP-binding protein [Sphaerotilus natans subsp. natans DSM 6575]|uniref:propionyl-CoA carboxylase n=1 Tax=Sphaerotilus natans subsp. natans DSM 6575 TaxID=1286631 RepID=A0A059KKW2_9BURK|nr:acetyl/propionyl/methylcrotonyl-CoA carboxylase subunit alpha [Sphaerotilus natans]KDB51859.1 carbamoyl-phosphate synthase L chain ATP-binding protein [Sphaerotilus natans subsp. natans DSM 6575]SIQ40787.1 propionyl-CoA carboxylase alpha chain [Sphaerotilus natans]
MFKKILIANRGEIACRVIATARKMGIKTVAVYSEADRDARHVELADEAVLLGPAPSRESYLVADKIIAACKATGAEALHPGYGFLSENEDFARRCEEEGIAFIGPKHYSIAAMGDKIASKKLANEARVSTIPGWNDAIESPERAVEIARDIGYPVMIKASAGGGGKGLRVAFNDRDAFDGFASCRNEARNSFGDDRVFIEKFVEQPRHIEIQILGDAHGNVVYLHERECSIQRRHQKVIEEAPSPFISDATRQAMGEQAVALAKAVKYQSAGTVEFVVGKNQDFYFLEMNTRLQVEHPVTECITGLDLVEQMIRVAAGEKLGFTQDQIPRQGWAIECRINAEDPFRNFLPSTGRLVKYQPPAADLVQGSETLQGAAYEAGRFGGVRVDTGVVEGGEIPMFYDSMIAKLIVHGRDRDDAIAKMRAALNGFVIRGISSNIPFQAALLAHPKFVSGDFNTGFIAEHYGKGFDAADVPHDDPLFLVALAAFVRRKARERAAGISGQLPGHGVAHAAALVVVQLGADGQNVYHDVQLGDFDAAHGTMNVTVGGRVYAIRSTTKLGDILMSGSVNGQPFSAQVERGSAKRPLAMRIAHDGTAIEALVLQPRAADLHKLMPYKAPPDTSKMLLSPMPGLLVQVPVAVGQKVQAGERLAVIEAMKMENILVATQDCVVKEIRATVGESLSVDQQIILFE